MELEKKMKYSLSETKYMIVKVGKKQEEDISVQVKTRNIKSQEMQILRNHSK